jgi:hypothetical protein
MHDQSRLGGIDVVARQYCGEMGDGKLGLMTWCWHSMRLATPMSKTTVLDRWIDARTAADDVIDVSEVPHHVSLVIHLCKRGQDDLFETSTL